MKRKNLSRYLYELENIGTELIIIILSLGALSVTGWVLFASSLDYTVMEFGNIIQPWIVMLGLMVIGRELWLINRKLSHHLEQVHGEGE